MNSDKEMQIQAAQELLEMRGKVIQISDICDISALCRQAKADVLFEYNLQQMYLKWSAYFI